VCHPNIIHMKEIFESPTCIYIVMPLVRGGDMFERLKEQHTFR
jgi:serine/threonine protein kinase